jgi:hypothetical protein
VIVGCGVWIWLVYDIIVRLVVLRRISVVVGLVLWVRAEVVMRRLIQG